MKKYSIHIILLSLLTLVATSCNKEFLELEPRGQQLESNFYQTEDDFFEALVAVYDVLQWGGTNGWTMLQGLLNAASDDCFAGGSSSSDQPSWVAWDNFTLDPNLGPQSGLWAKYYSGIYRANILLEKMEIAEDISPEFEARIVAETKFLRAYYYFDLVRLFGNLPLITNTLSGDELYSQTQSPPDVIYTQIEQDLLDAYNTFELPETLSPSDFGRVTKGAVTALLGKVILYQNDDSRMLEAAAYLQEVIDSELYTLEENFEDVFDPANEFSTESIFEIQYSPAQSGGWENFGNGTEGNYNVQFYGMRDYSGPLYSNGWSFCPITPDLVEFMTGDPRMEHTIIDGAALKNSGASYTEGYQNTDYFIRKYTPLPDFKATLGESALNWGYNEKVIRLADVLLMAAEALTRGGGHPIARIYVNRVRSRAGVQPYPGSIMGDQLLEVIQRERRLELATEGHRFFDLVRTGKAQEVLGPLGYMSGKNEWLPIPQREIDITEGSIVQNPNY